MKPGFQALAFFPFIFIRSENLKHEKRLILHEKIHWRQQIELLIIPFYIWYITEFLVKWIKYRSAKKAYFNISFEREAYFGEKNIYYLLNRKPWSHLKWI